MAKKDATIKIGKAKGRPMLTWVGKRPLTTAKAYPAQLIERYAPELPKGVAAATDTDWSDWPDKTPQGGLLFHGDNKDCLAWLLANGYRGKVKLIYIDPPFDSGADYVRKVQLRGQQQTTKLDGEDYTLGEQIQYTDIWANDNYLQFMYERLLMLRELLTEDGSLLLHCDDQKSHMLRCCLDETFGNENFRNEIIWKRSTSTGLATRRCGTLHDTIFWYSKSGDYKFNMQYHQHDEKYLERARKDESGRLYIPIPTGNPGPRPNLYYEYKGYFPHPNGYKWTKEKMAEFDREGRLMFPENKDGRIQLKQYLDEMEGVKLQDLWLDVYSVNPVAKERLPYPTQKSEDLLGRITKMISDSGDIVLDCFIGSGTTAAVAQKLGRRWIGCDINKGAIQTTAKRLQKIIDEQIAAASTSGKQQDLGLAPHPQPLSPQSGGEGSEDAPPRPAQFSFTSWRVNDYDLQVQHNEAVELACEHLGVTRTRADVYFDGTLGKTKLVKIVPFNHPLSPLDVEDVKRELKARPEDERDVILVSLGMEIAARDAIDEHNRHKPVNRIEVIELRSDRKHGGIFQHEAASAEVDIKRDGDEIVVQITDFLSPSILQRLNQEEGLFRAEIDDVRAQIDCVLIDVGHDGEVFDVTLADVPEKKQDLVEGSYRLPAPAKAKKGKTPVAVKIIDMLGEEVLVTATV